MKARYLVLQLMGVALLLAGAHAQVEEEVTAAEEEEEVAVPDEGAAGEEATTEGEGTAAVATAEETTIEPTTSATEPPTEPPTTRMTFAVRPVPKRPPPGRGKNMPRKPRPPQRQRPRKVLFGQQSNNQQVVIRLTSNKKQKRPQGKQAARRPNFPTRPPTLPTEQK